MICGIDAGSILTKAVVIDETQGKAIVYKTVTKSAGDPENITKKVLTDILRVLNIKKRELKVGITGRNCENLSITPKFAEMNCLATGMNSIHHNSKIIIDIGGFTNKVVKVENGRILDYLVNNICSSGSGVFLSLICKSLDIDVTEIDSYAFESTNPLPISSQCSIFAETEVIYLMNEGKKLEDIIAGACRSISGRLLPLILRVGSDSIENAVLTGGVGKSKFIREDLEKQLNTQVLLPDLDPLYVCAYGCALSLIDNGGGN
jgi:predicted CoA-substrate-specific enzyme activase